MTKKNKMNSLGIVLYEDWLVKSPPFTKIRNSASWHRRYFALLRINRHNDYIVPQNWSKKGPRVLEDLHDVYLMYWENKHDRNKGIKPIRTIPLFKGYTIEKDPKLELELKFSHLLALNTVERKYYLSAETDEKRTLWIDVLSQSLQVVQNKEAHSTEKDPMYESIREVLSSGASIKTRSNSSRSRSNSQLTSISESGHTNKEERDNNGFIPPPRRGDQKPIRTASLKEEKSPVIGYSQRPRKFSAPHINCVPSIQSTKNNPPSEHTKLNGCDENNNNSGRYVNLPPPTEGIYRELEPLYHELETSVDSGTKIHKYDSPPKRPSSQITLPKDIQIYAENGAQIVIINDIKIELPSDGKLCMASGDWIKVTTDKSEFCIYMSPQKQNNV